MELFKLLGSIVIDTDDANKAIKDTTSNAENAEDKLTAAFKKIGAAVAVAFAADTIKDFGVECMETAASLQASNSQFEQTFADYADNATAAINRVADASGIVDTRLKDAATSIYAFAKTTGMESTEALGLMERSLAVAADSAAYYDRSLEDVTETLKSFLKGNYENDAALGLSCTETTRNTAANKLFSKSFQDLSESQKQVTLLTMVEEANQLSGAMGQAARESDGYENVLGNIREQLKQLKGKIGQPILKTVIPAIKKLTDAVDKNADKFADALVPIIELFVGKLLPAAVELIVFAAENFELLATGIGVAVAAFSALKIVTTVTTAIQGATTAMGALNAVMMANPIGLVVGLLGGLAAVLIGLVATHKDENDLIDEKLKLIKDERQARQDNIDKVNEEMAAIDKKAQAELGEVANTERLWKELQTLCDEQGNVADADKARAEFILGQLNDALGTEYTMTGNQINQYKDLKQSVDDAIESKKAEILLAAEEEKYAESIQKVTEAEQYALEKQREISHQKNMLALAEKEWNEAKTKGRIYGFEQEYDAAQKAYENEKAKLEELQGAYSDNEALLKTYYENISTYEQASALILEGNVQAAIEVMDKQGQAFQTAAELAGKSAEEQKQILYDQSQNAQQTVEFYEGLLERASESEKAAIQDRLDAAKKEAEQAKAEYQNVATASMEAYIAGVEEKKEKLDSQVKGILRKPLNAPYANEYKSVGENMMQGVSSGIDSSKDGLFSKMGSVMRKLVEKAQDTLDINSPSRVFAREVGQFIPPGVSVGVEDNADEALDAIDTFSEDMVSRAKVKVGGLSKENTVASNMTVTSEPVDNTTAINNANLLNKLDQIINLMGNMKIYMNGDALVGEIAPSMNDALGELCLANERGL